MAGDLNPNWHNMTTTAILREMEQKAHEAKMHQVMSHTINWHQNQAVSHKQETIEWAKFAMWLRGFLSAIEGKELTAEDREKIMEKLATVDPESHGWKYDEPNPYAQPYHPHPGGIIPSPLPHPIGPPPTWVYRTADSTGDSMDDLLNKITSGTVTKDGK